MACDVMVATDIGPYGMGALWTLDTIGNMELNLTSMRETTITINKYKFKFQNHIMHCLCPELCSQKRSWLNLFNN